MTAAPARPAAGESGDTITDRRPRRRRLTPVNQAIAAATLIALGLRLYQLTGPGYLLGVTEYDDGSYFGSALHLVHGLMPYRDFVFVQPPGITLLMTPVALLSKVTGTAWSLAIGRILTTVASAAGVLLVGLLVRHRGVAATILACGLLAVYPDSVLTARTVLLEPWLVLFCLAGLVAVFDGDSLTSSRRRLAAGGLAFGLAGAVEAWAIVPVLVLVALNLPRFRRMLTCVAGIAVGFLVPVLPFVALAPADFFRDLVVAQAAPRPGSLRVANWPRVRDMAGLDALKPGLGVGVVAVAIFAVVAIGGLAAGWRITRRRPPALDWLALITTILVVAIFFVPDVFYFHFVAFLAPFAVMSLALPLSRLLPAAARLVADRTGRRPDLRPWARVLAGLVVFAFSLSVLGLLTHMHQGYTKEGRARARLVATAERVIPPGACVLTDQVSFTIAANRFVTSAPQCSTMDDGIGADLALSGGRNPGTGADKVPAVRAMWRAAFEHAQYVLLSFNSYRRVAWTPRLRAYFRANFRLVRAVRSGDALYVRHGVRPR